MHERYIEQHSCKAKEGSQVLTTCSSLGFNLSFSQCSLGQRLDGAHWTVPFSILGVAKNCPNFMHSAVVAIVTAMTDISPINARARFCMSSNTTSCIFSFCFLADVMLGC